MTGPTLPVQVAPPDFSVSGLLPHAVADADVVALPVLPGAGDGATPLLGPGADALEAALGTDLLGVLEVDRAVGNTGEVVQLATPAGIPGNPKLRLVLLVGVGDQRPTDFRRAGAAVARAARDRGTLATSIPALDPTAGLEAFVVGATLGSFGFHWRSSEPEHRPVGRVVLADLDAGDDQELVRRAVALGGAGWLARMLATVPSNLKTPAWLAEQAERIAADHDLKVRVWDEKQLAADGFGGIIGVGRGSANPPRMVRLDYTPKKARRGTPTVVLVGKGITFDSGGLNIKPGQAMTNMKRDMTGGAVVIATMAALAQVGCPVRVIGLIAAAENSISGAATRPGDVLRHYGGRTSEITNTDAEGRLVLADGMAYAVDKLRPDVLVDVATLTGGIKVALGQQVGGIFANHDALADALLAAGETSGEPLWRFPLFAGYEDNLSSKIADADNGPKGPQAIVAALFLQHFAGDVPWAHLDVASSGDVPEESFEWTVGPSGFGARVLLDWLGSDHPLEGIV